MDEKLKSAVSDLDVRIAELNEALSKASSQMSKPAKWGPREMLVHIVFAHELYVSYLRAMAAGQTPPLFKGLYREQNALALRENATEGVPSLVERLAAAQAELAGLVANRAVQESPFYFKERSKARSLDEALGEVASHIRGHVRDIRRLTRTSQPISTPRRLG